MRAADFEGFRGPPVKITIAETERSAAGQKFVKDVRGRFSNFKPVLSARGPLRALVDEAVLKNFDSEGEYAGQRWEKLARRTLLDKQYAKRSGNNILVFEGELRKFIASKTDRDRTVDFTEKTFKMTWDYPIMGFHQRGHLKGEGEIGAVNDLPSRPIVPEVFPESFMEAVKNLVRGYVVRGVVK